MNRDRAVICVMAIVALVAWILPGPPPVTAPITMVLPAPGALPVDLQASYGWASWYGKPFHGRKTADGTVYDMGGYSVAHRTLKLGTFVRITSMRTGLSCIAVVNDRGPYIEGREWDLSRAVAKRIGAIRHGVIPVKAEAVR